MSIKMDRWIEIRHGTYGQRDRTEERILALYVMNPDSVSSTLYGLSSSTRNDP